MSDLRLRWEACNKRKIGKSVLHEHNYQGLARFSMEKLWEELEVRNPEILTIFETITNCDRSKQEVRTKFSFIYSLLRHMSYHECSNLKRVLTVLLIEGGCSKEVSSVITFCTVYLRLCWVGRRYILLEILDHLKTNSSDDDSRLC